jgi:CRP-like cAMP-binding protein
VPAQTDIIREGEAGKGLFIIISGEVEVVRSAAGEKPMTLAKLEPGDIFGEMSLLANQPTSATVRALAPTSLLFLARGYFQRLVAAIPEVRQYFESVAAERGRDNSVRLGRRPVPDDLVEVDITDAILL